MLWDCASFEGQNVANKSKRRYVNKQSEAAVTSLCANNQIFAGGSEDGLIRVYNIEYGNEIIHQQQLDLEEDGPAIELHFDDTGSTSPMLVYATGFGNIIGWDLRQPLPKKRGNEYNGTSPAFKLENDLRDGVMTSMATNHDKSWAATGTSSGVITCWDMRFQLPIVKCTHPSEARIRQLVIPPHLPGSVLAAVQGNNEVGLWNLESRYRQKVLTTLNASNHSISALYPLQSVDSHSHVSTNILTAGTDMRVRFWDLQQPSNSEIVSFAANEIVERSTISYSKKLVEGTEVVEESIPKSKGNQSQTMHMPSPMSSDINDQRGLGPSNMNALTIGGPAHGHHDWISGMTLCKASYWYVVTGSRDGVIKVWK